MLPVAIDRLAVHKGVVRRSCDCMRVMRVRIIEIVVAARMTIEVVKIGVVYIDAAIVAPSAAIPRMKWLSPAEREPTKAAAPAKSKSEAEAAQPAHECRPIKR